MTAPKKNRERAVSALTGGSGDNMPYLCWVVGRSNDVRIVTLAKRLRISHLAAVGLAVKWEELVYFHGEASGRVRDLTLDDVAATLGISAAKLLPAMVESKLLSVSGRGRGRKLRHPTWARSRSGHHIREREETKSYWRERKREERRLAKAAAARAVAAQLAAAAEGGGNSVIFEEVSNGHPLDIHGTSLRRPPGVQTTRKEGRKDTGPETPPNPPQGGGSEGQRRWEEIRPLFESPILDGTCARLLDAYTPEEFEFCRWVLKNKASAGLLSLSRKKRAFQATSDKFLRFKLFTQFAPDRARLMAPKHDPSAQYEKTESRRVFERRKLIAEQLLDPDRPEDDKAKRKAVWLASNPSESEWLEQWCRNPHPITEPETNGVQN